MTPTRTPDVVTGVPGLLDGWCGPVERSVFGGEYRYSPWDDEQVRPGVDVRLDMTRPECVYRCLHWLADRGHPGCLWMLPTTHGGRIEAWDGLTAWEVSAILVARSVRRVVRGLGPVKHLLSAYGPEELFGRDGLEPHQTRRIIGGVRRIGTQRAVSVGSSGWYYDRAILLRGANVQFDDWVHGPETGDAGKLAADRAALDDGCALLVLGGVVLPEVPDAG